ncbi:hypothetical protein C1646_812050 [Rhizophagus diaphanus]|nr:hypothetical protein C1646_812050 [Rhizophagus diaphanus] [Rhizophagus sp. MUCL 43196]
MISGQKPDNLSGNRPGKKIFVNKCEKLYFIRDGIIYRGKDAINAKEVEAKKLVDELTPSLKILHIPLLMMLNDADGIFNADNTNYDNCDDADDKKNSDEREWNWQMKILGLIIFSMEQEVNEIRKTSISIKDGKTFACIDLVENYHECYKIKTRNRKAIQGDWCYNRTNAQFELFNIKKSGASKDYRCLNVLDNVSFDLGTRLQLSIGFGLIYGYSNGGCSNNKSGINESSPENIRHQVTQMNMVLEVVPMNDRLDDKDGLNEDEGYKGDLKASDEGFSDSDPRTQNESDYSIEVVLNASC